MARLRQGASVQLVTTCDMRSRAALSYDGGRAGGDVSAMAIANAAGDGTRGYDDDADDGDNT